MACNCNCCGKIRLEDITDPIVRKEITDIQNQLNIAICNNLNMVKVSNTYMTDMNYNPDGDLEARLNKEIQDRIDADNALQAQLEEEIVTREANVEQIYTDMRVMVEEEATARAEADRHLQEEIDNLESGFIGNLDEVIEEKIDEKLEPIENDIRMIKLWMIDHSEYDEELWRREQRRAMTVEENLQRQIYEIIDESR